MRHRIGKKRSAAGGTHDRLVDRETGREVLARRAWDLASASMSGWRTRGYRGLDGSLVVLQLAPDGTYHGRWAPAA